MLIPVDTKFYHVQIVKRQKGASLRPFYQWLENI